MSCEDNRLRETVKTRIRNARLKDQVYIWVNAIKNMARGDNYAMRLVHPNLPETEGILLSTKTKDIKGNTPYLTELEGVKKYSEIYFDYWFKKPGSERIEHKLTFARLYKPWNWIIASGVYLDDIEVLTKNRAARAERLLGKQERTAVILAICAAVVAMLLSLLFNRKIDRVLDFYAQKVTEHEEELKQVNLNLESLVADRARDLLAAERHFQLLYDNAPISLWLEDFSAVKERFATLQKEGVTDFHDYFSRHPEVVAECAELVRVIDVNRASVQLHNARSKDELLRSLTRTFTEESFWAFAEELIALAEGAGEFATDAVIQTLDGEKKTSISIFSSNPSTRTGHGFTWR